MMGRMVLVKVVRDGSLEGLLYAQRHDEKREHVHDGETSLLGGGKNGSKVHEAEANLACSKNSKRASATRVVAVGTRAGQNEVRGTSRSSRLC